MTVNTRESVTIARPDIIAELPARNAHEVRPADGIRGDPPDLEGRSSDTNWGCAQ
jgi:hypothetical protein